MAHRIVTRQEAKTQGLKRYFTGNPCVHGHIAERYVVNCECVTCRYKKTKAFEWWRKHRDEDNARSAEWRLRNPAKVAATRAKRKILFPDYTKAQWHRLPIKIRQARKRAWYEANRKHAIRYTAEWCEQNPERSAALKACVSARRRARKAASPGQHIQADLRVILKAQGHLCASCRADLRKIKRHLDHIMPFALGGSNDKSNLQYLCAPCNLAKGAKDPILFAREHGRLL